jgi:hypothetical protein
MEPVVEIPLPLIDRWPASMFAIDWPSPAVNATYGFSRRWQSAA